MAQLNVSNIAHMPFSAFPLDGVSSKIVYVGNVCDSYPCWNDAFCVPLNSSDSAFKCICGNDYAGERCEFKISEFCSNFACPSGSKCVVKDGAADCVPRAALNVFESCDDQLCLNGGRCLELDIGRHQCLCTGGFHGAFCQFTIDDTLSLPDLSPISIVFLISIAFFVFLSILLICHSSNLACYLIVPGEQNYTRWEDEDEEDRDRIPLGIVRSDRIKASITADTIVDLEEPSFSREPDIGNV